eukprot:GEMP01088967.1.p2 GENE.GEMP01088967.1~~GEMP01088967.1.p2  ORF type:complete len:124 (+),score=23.91 GEMP01088967.1:40-411(+)
MTTSMSNASYGGLMGQGFVPPGQMEDLLNLIRQSASAASRAINASKMAQMAASAAASAGQQAVTRSLHMVNTPGITSMDPFSPGASSSSMPMIALVATLLVAPSFKSMDSIAKDAPRTTTDFL